MLASTCDPCCRHFGSRKHALGKGRWVWEEGGGKVEAAATVDKKRSIGSEYFRISREIAWTIFFSNGGVIAHTQLQLLSLLWICWWQMRVVKKCLSELFPAEVLREPHDTAASLS